MEKIHRHGPLSHWCREGKTSVVRLLKKTLFLCVSSLSVYVNKPVSCCVHLLCSYKSQGGFTKAPWYRTFDLSLCSLAEIEQRDAGRLWSLDLNIKEVWNSNHRTLRIIIILRVSWKRFSPWIIPNIHFSPVIKRGIFPIFSEYNCFLPVYSGMDR